MSAYRYIVKSGDRITRVDSFHRAVEVARKWFIEYRLPVIIKDARKMFNPTIVDSLDVKEY